MRTTRRPRLAPRLAPAAGLLLLTPALQAQVPAFQSPGSPWGGGFGQTTRFDNEFNPAISFTVDTLEELHARHPQERLWFVLGADTLPDLAAWHEPDRLFELASFALATRPGFPNQLDDLLPPRFASERAIESSVLDGE